MEKRFEIVKLDAALVDEIVRATSQRLFSMGCGWTFPLSPPCGADVEYRCTETRRYRGKRGEEESISFYCGHHAIEWAKRTGAAGADKLFPTLAVQP